MSSDDAVATAVRTALRTVPDFPKPGILFRDLTPVVADPTLLVRLLDALASPFATAGITKVAAIESRGFIFGAPVAERLGAGLVPVRKLGRLPARTVRASYALEYGEATLELHADAVTPADRVLVVDDVLATGGTAAATIDLVEACGGAVAGLAFVLGIVGLDGRRRLGDRAIAVVADV